MCPKCKSIDVIRLLRQTGTYAGKNLANFYPGSLAEVTAVICNNCKLLLYDEKYGWTEDLVNKAKGLKRMAISEGLTSSKQIEDFLEQMGIPRAYTPEGVYYYE